MPKRILGLLVTISVCLGAALLGVLFPSAHGFFDVRDASTLDLSSTIFDADNKALISSTITLAFARDGRLARRDVRTVHARSTTSVGRMVFDPSLGQADIALDADGVRLVRPFSDYRRRMLLRPPSTCVGFMNSEQFTGTRTVEGVLLEVFEKSDDNGRIERARSPEHGCWPLEQHDWGFDGRLHSSQIIAQARPGADEAAFDVQDLPLVASPPERLIPPELRNLPQD